MDYKGLKELLEGCINDKCEEFPAELDNLIADTARTGIVRLPWELLKPLFNYRLQKVFAASFDELTLEGEDKTFSQQLLDQLNKFDNPPFTIQRICELIVDPKKNYKKRDKYMRALERCLLVVSTQEPDLTWMKSPRLTQLLEEPPRESLHEVVFDENMVKEFGSSPVSGSGGGGVWSNLRRITNDSEQPSSPSESDQFNQAKSANPVTQGDDKGGEKEEASTSTMDVESMEAKDATTSTNPTTLVDDNSDSTPESSSNSPEREGMDEKSGEGAQPFPLSRKRSSSMRESLDSGEGNRSSRAEDERERDENDRRTVLQEADSTTLGDNGQDVEDEDNIDLELEKEEDGDSDLEQSTPKKMRASSPSIEVGSAGSKKMAMSPKGIGNVDKRDTVSGPEACHVEVEKVKSHETESKSSSSEVIHQSDLGEGEEAESVSVGELHSSSERETSTGQLEEKSRDSNNNAVNEAMETS